MPEIEVIKEENVPERVLENSDIQKTIGDLKLTKQQTVNIARKIVNIKIKAIKA
jgi:hypothetical protein